MIGFIICMFRFYTGQIHTGTCKTEDLLEQIIISPSQKTHLPCRRGWDATIKTARLARLSVEVM
ncbi:MAG: hypothetical protein ACP5UA_03205 [Candidatus Hydrogenedens sp.]